MTRPGVEEAGAAARRPPQRPAVTVILPFAGSAGEADEALRELGRMRRGDGDEILVADNTVDGVALGRPAPDGVTVFRAPVPRSAYAARNFAAERAANEWLLLVDADCRLPADLLDRFFVPPPAPQTGAVAGQVLGVPDQRGLVPRYIRARRHLDQEWLAHEHPFRPMAVTANLLVRRAAWAAVGGFAEGTRSGADADFCWRLGDAGWGLELCQDALVHHEHRDTLGALLRQSARDGAGGRWLSRRYRGYPAHPKLARELVRAVGGGLVWALRGETDRAVFKLIDGVWCLAAAAGSLGTNAAPAETCVPATVALLDAFPCPQDPLASALAGLPQPVRVEAVRRPARGDWPAARGVAFHFAEDDGAGHRARALAALARRRPAAPRDLGRGAELAPAALRLARSPAARVVAAPGRADDAVLLLRLAGRRASEFELL